MSIKILKEGQKEFAAHCKWCGCEFTYEISDLKLSATGDKLDCPCCGKTYYHTMQPQEQSINIPAIPFSTYSDPCEGCAWKDFSNKNWNYVGDTPCTWCHKRQVTNAVSTGITLSGVDRIPCNCDATSSCSKCSGTTGTTTATNCVDVSKFKEKTVELDLTCMCQGDVWKSCDDCQGGCSGRDNSISELMKPACKMYKYEG